MNVAPPLSARTIECLRLERKCRREHGEVDETVGVIGRKPTPQRAIHRRIGPRLTCSQKACQFGSFARWSY
jgi:hypothetical protein